MSNVLARKRGISEMEFYKNANEIRTQVSALLMRDKIIPKKWRHNITYRALDIIEDMMEYMHEANRIFPYTDAEADERKRIQSLCIKCNDDLWELFQGAMQNVWWQKLHSTNQEGNPTKERLALEYHLDEIGRLIDREEQLLIGWRRSTKVLKR